MNAYEVLRGIYNTMPTPHDVDVIRTLYSRLGCERAEVFRDIPCELTEEQIEHRYFRFSVTCKGQLKRDTSIRRSGGYFYFHFLEGKLVINEKKKAELEWIVSHS